MHNHEREEEEEEDPEKGARGIMWRRMRVRMRMMTEDGSSKNAEILLNYQYSVVRL